MNGVTSLPTSVNTLMYYNRTSFSGKMEVPVMASQSLYANFTYVQGVPSESGGLSLDRLKIIDSLIAQINNHRAAGTAEIKATDLDLKQPDQTISRLAQEAFKMQKSAQESPLPYKNWAPSPGLVLDFRA